MRTLNIHGANDVRLDAKASPVPGEGDVVVRIKACGICGSDLSYVKWGGVGPSSRGITPIGHEAAGEIVAVGDAVEGAYVGQRVVINPMNTPSNIGGGGTEGAFSNAVLVKDARIGVNILEIADDLPYDLAALSEPLSVALHGVNRAHVEPGDKVVVFGCGPIGLGMVMWLIDRGISDVIAVDLIDERLDQALALGACATINPAKEDFAARLRQLHGSHESYLGLPVAETDAYIDAAGGVNILNDVIRVAKRHARYVLTAAHARPVPVNLQFFLTTEMTITSGIGYPTEMPEVLAAIPRLRDKLSKFITHRFSFDDILEGFAIAATPQSTKVMIEFEETDA